MGPSGGGAIGPSGGGTTGASGGGTTGAPAAVAGGGAGGVGGAYGPPAHTGSLGLEMQPVLAGPVIWLEAYGPP
jgi:hypothetical protein